MKLYCFQSDKMLSRAWELRHRPWYALLGVPLWVFADFILFRYAVIIVAWTAFAHPGMFGALNVCSVFVIPSKHQLTFSLAGTWGKFGANSSC